MTLFDTVNKHVKARNVHLDKKSFEQSTGIIKSKYKLAGHPIKDLDQFIFFILSSNSDAYHKVVLVKICDNEWINRNPNLSTKLRGESCIDITRHEILSSRIVGLKLTDKKNGFKYVAELPEGKFEKLQKKMVRLKYLKKPVATETKRLIAKTLQVTAPDIMKKLGIN